MRLGNILLVKVNQEQPPEIHLPPDPCVQINIGKIITMPEIDDDLVTPVTTINLIFQYLERTTLKFIEDGKPFFDLLTEQFYLRLDFQISHCQVCLQLKTGKIVYFHTSRDILTVQLNL